MRATPLMLAITLALALPANDIAQAASNAGNAQAQSMRTYIISFDEEPLALFKGFASDRNRPALAATSPAVTGARSLDVKARASVEYRNYLKDLRNIRLNEASSRIGRQLKPTFVYDVANNGIAIDLTEAEASAFAKVPGVRRVRPEFMRYPMGDRGPTWIKANTIWDGTANSGVLKKGEGTIIGVIDTGINHNASSGQSHPSFSATGPVDGYVHINPKGAVLGKCLASEPAVTRAVCNNKLIGVYDLTSGGGESDNGADNATGSGHGTHTASTAGGNFVIFNTTSFGTAYAGTMSGVAPHANIISYKACEKTAACRGAWTLAAINQAVADQVNVINYSIGGAPSDPFATIGTGGGLDDDAEAFLAARAAGIVVAAAAGNDGPTPGSHGNPANSPWVLGVAANSHDRAAANNLKSLTATGAGSPPGGSEGLFGAGNSGTSSLSSFPIVVADPIKCAEGTDPETDPATGVSKPAVWNAGTYTGKIVICERGFYARVAKANNVKNAGGVGMILVNQLEEGDSVVALNYDLPSTHLSYIDGQALLAWMSSGTAHAGLMTGVAVQNVSTYGDKLGDFSGRGPVIPFGVVKPDITAPGVSILAAAVTGLGSKVLTGTSMASPHIAGAAALLKSAKPTWTPSQIQSALMLTARPSNLENGVLVTPHDQGSGTADLQQAVQAGLFLNVTDSQFKAATALTAQTLNLPSLGNDQCFQSCALTRTFTDMAGGGTYSVQSTLPSGVTMTPSVASFTVGSGATQAVSFDFNVSSALGTWIYGEVRLVKTAGIGAATLRLPVAIYSSPFLPGTSPAPITHSTTTERGFFDVTLGNLAPLPDARFVATELVTPKTVVQNIALDPTNTTPYDNATGTYRDTLVIPASPVGGPVTYKIKVTTAAAQPDIDLYVGFDANSNGLPAQDEQLCVSGSPASDEICELSVTTTSTAQTYWIVAQNWEGSGNSVTIESVAVPLAAGAAKTLVATGPGNTPSLANFKIRLVYDDPTMLNGQRRFGYIFVQGTAGLTAFEVPVTITRTAAGFSPYALSNAVPRSVTLPTGSTHDKLYFDVPPNATSVTFTTAGTGTVRLDASHLASPTAPAIQSAPGTNNATSNVAGANQSITLTGGSLLPGRWYLKPTNNGGATTAVNVTATVNTFAATAAFKPGSYFNPARPGHGLFIYQIGTVWFGLWYTYNQDGSPTWYTMEAPAPTGTSMVWTSPINRVSYNPTATAALEVPVGTANLSMTSANTFSFNYNLDGETGSETMSAFVTGCPTLNAAPLDVSAAWYSPASPGFGYSVQVNPNYEFIATFVYDSMGTPRFLLAEREAQPFNAANTSIPLSQVQGFCPLCTLVSPTFTTVGTLTRNYATNDLLDVGVNATFVNGVPGTWNRSTTVDILGSPQGCTP